MKEVANSMYIIQVQKATLSRVLILIEEHYFGVEFQVVFPTPA